jgi:hypothetical protein
MNMSDIDVNPNIVGGVDALTLVAGMAGKPLAEALLSKFVGNGTFVSGAAKIVAAVAVNKFVPGKIGNIGAIAVGADGAEDLILAFAGRNVTAQKETSGVDF